MCSARLVFGLIILFVCSKYNNGTTTHFVSVNTSTVSVFTLHHFWKSSGFCPPDPKTEIRQWLLSKDVKFNLMLISALPNRGIRQIRIHWLINMIGISKTNHELVYDFTSLDFLLIFLRKHELRPVFELMAVPVEGTYVSKEYYFWYDLVRRIAERYTGKFNLKEIAKWRFETWNEPDLKVYNVLNFTIAEYFEYVHACASGLHDTFMFSKHSDSQISNEYFPKFGGPAGVFKQYEKHPLCWGLLEMCNNKSENGCPLQYISFHKKGDGNVETLLNGTLELLDDIHNNYANLRNIPVANDEADLLPNWSKSEDWRGDTRYAAMIAKAIMDFYKKIVIDRNLKIEMLSNDNAFINYHPYYFTQRTLLVRFQMNNTRPSHIQFVKKPVYSVMGLLSLLGEHVMEIEPKFIDPFVSVLATRSKISDSVTVIVVYANNMVENRSSSVEFDLKLQYLNGSDTRYVIYALDNVITNSFSIWKNAGSPVFPDAKLRQRMRNVQEPNRVSEPKPVRGYALNLHLKLTLPSVALVHVCSLGEAPGKVTRLTAHNVTYNEVILLWKSRKVKIKCIKTYEVEFLSNCDAGSYFQRINPVDSIFLSYQYSPKGSGSCEVTTGRYRVRAVDYWNRAGKYSKTVRYP